MKRAPQSSLLRSKTTADLLVVVGGAIVVWGVHQIHPPSAYIAGGVFVAALGLFS